ncbi:MAG: hypothetical protein R3B69_01760 [Candidatus Paceibacterota bacterium]
MTYHLLYNVFGVQHYPVAVYLLAVLTSVGVSALNEIMEFIIAMSLERNGVGGYENAMLDFVFNLSGALSCYRSVRLVLQARNGRKTVALP